MRKIITIIVCASTILCVAGCQKPGNENTLDDRLVGTKWQTFDLAYQLFYGGNPYEVYEFVSTTEVECYVTNNSSVVQSKGTFAYALNYPHITIKRSYSDGQSEVHYTFKDARTMVRDDIDEGNYYSKYLKQ